MRLIRASAVTNEAARVHYTGWWGGCVAGRSARAAGRARAAHRRADGLRREQFAITCPHGGIPGRTPETRVDGEPPQHSDRHSLGGVRCGVEATIREGAHHTGTRRRSCRMARIAGAWDRSTAPGDVAEYNLERKRTSSTSSAGLLKRRAIDTYPRYGWARPGHACLWTDILNPL